MDGHTTKKPYEFVGSETRFSGTGMLFLFFIKYMKNMKRRQGKAIVHDNGEAIARVGMADLG